MFLKNILFWQPKQSLFKLACKTKFGSLTLVFFNYLIWFFLALISFRLVAFDANIFWQLFLATLMAEIIERFSKSFFFWSRPICIHKYTLPPGLVKSWYDTGSFPSGHTGKTVFFLLFINQYSIMPVTNFLLVTVPLLLFRVLVGFHYPIDVLGGILVGLLTWGLSHQIIFPLFLTDPITNIFNFILK